MSDLPKFFVLLGSVNATKYENGYFFLVLRLSTSSYILDNSRMILMAWISSSEM